jgi:hypothetical protein
MNERPIFLAFDDLEVEFLKINDLPDGCASLIFKLHRDQTTDDIFNSFRHRKGKRFKICGVQIGDDEQAVPQPAEEQRQPASATGEPPARVKSKITQLASMARNNTKFQGWCIDTFAPGTTIADPLERMEFARQCIYDQCGIDTNKKLLEGTPEAEAFLDMYDSFKNEFVREKA